MLKDALKILSILIVGLIVAIFIYPFLHESGHIITAIFVGADVVEFTLLPLPSVLCETAKVGGGGIVAISFGGIVFPLLISLLVPRKWFFTWYLRALLQGISVLALIVSCISVLFVVNTQDDMHLVLRVWKISKPLLLLILSSNIVVVLSLIFLDGPWDRICKFMGV